MKNFLNTIFQTTEERLKNPFVGAFISAWVAFNWRPIIILFFSDTKIEEKIRVITDNYDSLLNLLWYPLMSALFYILILPYINLLIDVLLSVANSNRNKILIKSQKLTISNKQEIALAEISLEEAKTEFRERKSHNKLVEELQEKVKSTEAQLIYVKEMNEKTIQELRMESMSTNEKVHSLMLELHKKEQDRIGDDLRFKILSEKFNIPEELLSDAIRNVNLHKKN